MSEFVGRRREGEGRGRERERERAGEGKGEGKGGGGEGGRGQKGREEGEEGEGRREGRRARWRERREGGREHDPASPWKTVMWQTFSIQLKYQLFVESKVGCLYHRGNRRCCVKAVEVVNSLCSKVQRQRVHQRGPVLLAWCRGRLRGWGWGTHV